MDMENALRPLIVVGGAVVLTLLIGWATDLLLRKADDRHTETPLWGLLRRARIPYQLVLCAALLRGSYDQAELLLGLRVDRPPLDQPALRLAIARAIDRAAIVRTVYPDDAVRLDAIVPPSLSGGPADLVPGHDLREARRLVREAYPDGRVPTVALMVSGRPSRSTSSVARVPGCRLATR